MILKNQIRNHGRQFLGVRLMVLVPLVFCASCGGSGGGGVTAASATLQHILFVGDSFTHGRYTPVRTYNSGGTQGTTGSVLVVDENFGQTGARSELETGPWGGAPGIFAELAQEFGLNYDVHIEAISTTSLTANYAAAASILNQSLWNTVVLQEISTRPLTNALTGDSTSDPANFCAAVQTIEQGVHAAAPTAKIYLYETWARANMAQTLAGSTTASGFSVAYANALAELGAAYHNVYYSAAAHDGNIAGVAPVGDAWTRAWSESIAYANPYVGSSNLPSLWYGINSVNNPAISTADEMHPSLYGAYLNGLVLFQQITGKDVRTLGGSETAAVQLGVSAALAVQLQQIAWEAVTQESSTPINQSVDPCTVTH